MKKCYLYLLCTILLLNCIGCGPKFAGYNAAKWDGSIASGYAGGDGTETNPYQISSPEQLAYLAQEVNGGNEYREKFFTLEADIDLNNLEWTPIGKTHNIFFGFFDGKNHTIKNLSLSKVETSENPFYMSVPKYDTAKWGQMGLFGDCQDTVIKNLNIDGVNISIKNIKQYDLLHVGVLVGQLFATNNGGKATEISNINLSNVSLSILDPDSQVQKNLTDEICIGGLIGYIHAYHGAIKIDKIQAETEITYNKNGYMDCNFIGGIVGNVLSQGSVEISNIANYATITAPTEAPVFSCLGAIGNITARPGDAKITNMSSVINTPHSLNNSDKYQVNAIAGCVSYSLLNTEGVVWGRYEFTNLFGYVKNTNNGETATRLYELSEDAKYTETNCKGCTSLPDEHNLPTDIWDIKDPKKPCLISN